MPSPKEETDTLVETIVPAGKLALAARTSTANHDGDPPQPQVIKLGIESLNRSLRKISKNRGGFPHEESLLKLYYLALERVAKKWTMPIPNWSAALNRFAIEFGARRVFMTFSPRTDYSCRPKPLESKSNVPPHPRYPHFSCLPALSCIRAGGNKGASVSA